MCGVVRVCVGVSIWQLFICVGRWTNTRCQIRLEIRVMLDERIRKADGSSSGCFAIDPVVCS